MLTTRIASALWGPGQSCTASLCCKTYLTHGGLKVAVLQSTASRREPGIPRRLPARLEGLPWCLHLPRCCHVLPRPRKTCAYACLAADLHSLPQ